MAVSAELRFLTALIRDEAKRYRLIHLGYSESEERVWVLFNRSCHAGRAIKMKPRPMRMAAGKPIMAFRR